MTHPTKVTLWGKAYSIENTTELHLNNRGLIGSIPPEIGNLTNLTQLYLSGNQLTGSIPPQIGNLTNLTYLSLRDNQLTDSIPREIGTLVNLTYLDLGRNALSGVIPESICDLNIDWSNNNLFNIHYNQLCLPYPSCINYAGGQDMSNCA